MLKKAIRRPLGIACVLAALAMLFASGPANALVHVHITTQNQSSPVPGGYYNWHVPIIFSARVALNMDRIGSATGTETAWCQGSTGYIVSGGTSIHLVKAAPASSFTWQNGDFTVRYYDMGFMASTYLASGDYYTACLAQYRTPTTGGIVTVIKRSNWPFHVTW